MATETTALSSITRRLFTVEDYHKMAQAGILREDERIELIEGEIIQMTPIGPPHMSCLDRLNVFFVVGLHGRAIVRVGGSVRLSNLTEPQPDLLVLKHRSDFYARVVTWGRDVLLAVEVSDSSLPYDRDRKAALYARMGIPETWLFDVNSESILVFRGPTTAGYGSLTIAREDESLSPEAFPDLKLTPRQVFGNA